jgi:voltage-gated potassium channel
MDNGGPEQTPPGGTPRRLADLDASMRRRAVAKSVATVGTACVLIVGAFYILPFDHLSDSRSVLRLSVVLALVGAVFVWQIRRITAAELPELRAVEALGIVIAVFLIGFSVIYLSMSNSNPRTFSQVLNHTRALYFTISVFSTVGFGDITPRTDTARLVVSAQMLLDLALIGAVVRLIFNAARSRIAPAGGAASSSG